MKWRQLAVLAVAGCSAADPRVTLTAAPPCVVPAEPVQLARPEQCPAALAVDDRYVYWLDGTRLSRIAKCGDEDGPERLMDTFAYELAVDGDAVYLAEGARLLRLSLHDGVVKPLLERDGQFDQIWVDADYVYASLQSFVFDDGGSGSPLIQRVPRRGGGRAEPILSGEPIQIYDLVGDGEHLYYSSWMPVLGRVDTDGSDERTLVPGNSGDGIYRLATDGAYVYFQSGTALRRLPVGGGAMELVAQDVVQIAGLALDGSYVYWSDAGFGLGGSLHRAPLAGGPAKVLVDDPTAGAFVLDRGAIYFGSCGAEFSNDPGIWIMRR